MRVLIAHDREETRHTIEVLLKNDLEGIVTEEVYDARNLRDIVSKKSFDLAIVDLTLPYHSAGGNATSYEPVDNALNSIFESEELFAPGDIIGITKEAGAFSAIATNIGQHLMSIISEDDQGLWKRQLIDKIKYVQKASKSRKRSFNEHYDADLILLTALDHELAPFQTELKLDIEQVIPTDTLGQFLFKDKNGKIRKGLCKSFGRAGQVSAASITQSLLTQYRPKLIIMTGFCGGFADSKVGLGDLILGESFIDWDYGRWGKGENPEFISRPSPISISDSYAHTIFRNLISNGLECVDELNGKASSLSEGEINGISIQMGPVASGSAVVAHQSIIEKIKGIHDKILGVDMEGYGVAHACTKTPVKSPQFMFLKSVCDLSNEYKEKTKQGACAYISARVAYEIFTKVYDFELNDYA